MHEILFPQQVAMFWPRVIIPDSSKCIVYIVKYYVCVLLDHHLLSSIDRVLFSMFMENVLVIAEGAAFILCIIANLSTKKARLKAQIPDIKTSLDIVKHLQSRKGTTDPMETRFLLSDQVYAKARIPPTENVNLWLGANVMLEYGIEDAKVLLEKNLEAANKSLSQVEDDLSFIRDQTTTLEVNMARVYNWDVKRRQASQAKS